MISRDPVIHVPFNARCMTKSDTNKLFMTDIGPVCYAFISTYYAMRSKFHLRSYYRIAQNFGRANFWQIVPSQVFGREILVDPA